MQYNLAARLDRERFRTRAAALMERGVVVEMTEKTFRTIRQNSYLHLIIGVVAMETGNTIEDTKRHYFKELCNADIFRVRKRDRLGNELDLLRSSSDVTKEEMSTAIDRFKRWAAQNGIYLPEPGDEALLKDIAVELDRNRQWL